MSQTQVQNNEEQDSSTEIDNLIQKTSLLQVSSSCIEEVNKDSEDIPNIIRRKQEIKKENSFLPPDKQIDLRPTVKTGLLAKYTKISEQEIEQFLKGYPINKNVFIELCSKLKINTKKILDINFLRFLVVSVPKVRSKRSSKIQDQCGTLQILDVSRPIGLDDLYVDVNILNEPNSYISLELDDLPKVYDSETDEFNRFCIGNVRQPRISGLEAILNYSKLMVLGKPGAGKSTFLQYIAIRCNRGQLQQDRIPIFIRLKTFYDDAKDRKNFSLLDYIKQEFADSGISELSVIENMLHHGRSLILLDGLDEVPESNNNKVVEEIRHFTERYYRNQFIITCRIAAQQNRFSGFTYIEIADFNSEQIKNFAKKWFLSVEKKSNFEAEIRTTQFIKKLYSSENQQIQELAVTPILLNLICLVFQANAKFPSNRAMLYEEGLEILLNKWDDSRGIKRDKIYRNLSLDSKIELLSQIAAISFEKNRYFFGQDEVQQCIEDYLFSLPDASKTRTFSLKQDSKAALKSIEAQYGLLIERARRIYSFSHLTFQEYFTARHIVNSFDPRNSEKTFSNITKKSWREVFLLAVGMVRNADELLLLVKRKIDDFLASDFKLQQLLESVNLKSQTVLVGKPAAIRAFYFSFYFNDNYTFDLTLNLDSSLGYGIERFFDLNVDLMLMEALKIALDLEYDLSAYTLEDNFNEEIEEDELNENSESIPPEQLLSKLENNIIDCLSYIDEQDDELYELLAELDDLFPAKNSDIESFIENNIKILIAKLYQIVNDNRKINFEQSLNDVHKRMLEQYYHANKLLVECLQTTTNLTPEVKQQLEDSLLLPIGYLQN